MRCVWAYALLISVQTYLRYPPWDSKNGTNTIPVLNAMKKIVDSGKADELLIEFDVNRCVKHLYGRTRRAIGNPTVNNYIVYENNPGRASQRLAKLAIYDTPV